MSAEKLLHSPDETAELLGCGRSYVFELIARGEIESFKVGRLRKVPREAIHDYIQRLRDGAAQPVGSGDHVASA
jgi:excisionase family DNA binding protein